MSQVAVVDNEIVKYAEGAKPSFTEVAAISSSLSGMKLLPYNPDDLVRSKGKGLQVYQEMMKEAYVKSALLQKKTRLINVGWDILPASKDAKDVEIAAFVKWNLNTFIKGAFTRDLFEMLDAINNGFSISEKIWGQVETGKWKGKIALQNLKSKDPNYFDFQTDKYGNLGDNGLVMTPSGGGAKQNLPVNKFVIFSYLMTYENYYGTSDLRAAYRAYWIKDTAWKLRAIYMERFSGNNLKGKYPKNDEKAKEALLQIFRTWQQETGVAIPEGCEIDVMTIATSSDSEYARSIADCNHEIQIAILGQTLTMDVGKGGTGSRALGQVHDGVLDDLVMFLDAIMMVDVNAQIVRDIVDYNYDVDEYPTWTFKSRESFDGQAFSTTVTNLARLKGLNIPIRWVKEKYKIPEPEDGEGIIKELQLGSGGFPAPGDQAQQDGQPQPEAQPKAEAQPKPDKAPVKMSEPATTSVALKSQGPYWRALNRFEIFSEVPRIDRETDALITAAKDSSVSIYDTIKDDIVAQVERKGVLDNRDYSGIEKIRANVGELKQFMADVMLKANLTARADIAKLSDSPLRFAEADYVPDKALKALASRAGVTKKLFEEIVGEMRGRAFTVAGLEQAAIEKDVKSLLLQAIKNGDDLKAFKFRLSESFVKYSMPVYGGVGEAGDAILDYHAETIFRTNVMDAYNQGRKDALSDKDVVSDFPAWQYSAILDGRVRDTHAKMDGKVFMADDPIWNRITPPNGYKCRCTFVPISKYDFTRDMLASSGDVPSGFPDSGFG